MSSWNDDKFDGSHTGKYSRYERDNYLGFKLFFIAIILMVTFATLVFTGKVHAATNVHSGYEIIPHTEYFDGFGDGYCQNPISPKSMPLFSHDVDCSKGTSESVAPTSKHASETAVTETAVTTVSNDTPPTNEVPPTVTNDNPPSSDNVHANSGRGNGSEDTDGDGIDNDPGNSGAHNHGGD